jgi:hypothetical protein
MFNQGTSTDTKVAVLEEKVSIYEQMMRKIEDAIYAISETSQGISKMLAIHEERLEQAMRSDEVIIKLIDDLKKEVESEDLDLSERIDEVLIKLEEVRKIKWMTMGVGVFAAVLIGALANLASGMLTPSHIGVRLEHNITAPDK